MEDVAPRGPYKDAKPKPKPNPKPKPKAKARRETESAEPRGTRDESIGDASVGGGTPTRERPDPGRSLDAAVGSSEPNAADAAARRAEEVIQAAERRVRELELELESARRQEDARRTREVKGAEPSSGDALHLGEPENAEKHVSTFREPEPRDSSRATERRKRRRRPRTRWRRPRRLRGRDSSRTPALFSSRSSPSRSLSHVTATSPGPNEKPNPPLRSFERRNPSPSDPSRERCAERRVRAAVRGLGASSPRGADAGPGAPRGANASAAPGAGTGASPGQGAGAGSAAPAPASRGGAAGVPAERRAREPESQSA